MIAVLTALLLQAAPGRPVPLPVTCPIGPGAAVLSESVAVDPRDPDRAFVVAFIEDHRSVFRTANRGGCLVPSDDGLERNYPFFRPVNPYALSVDPQHPDVLYLGSGQGVYQSVDRGRSWQQRSFGIPFSLGEANMGRVAVDPLRSDVLYVGGDGIFKSVDGGDSWTYAQNGFPQGYFPPAYGFAFDSRNTDIVYLATYRLSKSLNGGELWEPSDAGLPGPVAAVAVDRADPDVVYAGTSIGLFVSLDAGVTWSPGPLSGLAVSDLQQAVADPGVFLANTGGGLFKSTDGGAVWAPLTTPFQGAVVYDVSIAPSDAATFYAATGVGVFRSRDGGETWTALGFDRRGPRALPER